MDQIKNNLKKLGRYAETRLARSVLRWKYKNEDKPVPPENELDNKSRQIAIDAHKVIAKRGKNIWNELKEACFNGSKRKEDSSE
jgi:hypothetical protein